MAVQSQPFSHAQTVIPTPHPESHAESATREPCVPQHVQDRMFTLPDVMRGQLALGTDHA